MHTHIYIGAYISCLKIFYFLYMCFAFLYTHALSMSMCLGMCKCVVCVFACALTRYLVPRKPGSTRLPWSWTAVNGYVDAGNQTRDLS